MGAVHPGRKEIQSKKYIPVKPAVIPFLPTEENIQKLKEYLIKHFETTTFNREGVFPKMTGPPMKIYLKPDAVLKCRNSWNNIPLHMKGPAKEA